MVWSTHKANCWECKTNANQGLNQSWMSVFNLHKKVGIHNTLVCVCGALYRFLKEWLLHWWDIYTSISQLFTADQPVAYEYLHWKRIHKDIQTLGGRHRLNWSDSSWISWTRSHDLDSKRSDHIHHVWKNLIDFIMNFSSLPTLQVYLDVCAPIVPMYLGCD